MTDDRQPSRGRRFAALGTTWLLIAVLLAVTRYATGSLIGDHDTGWPEAAVHGALVGAVTTVVLWFTQLPTGSAPQKVISRAIRRGRLPDDVDADELRTGLGHVRRVLSVAERWCGGLLLGVLVLCLVVGVVTGELAPVLVAAGLTALAVGVLLAACRWQLRRIDRLVAELDARPTTAGAA